MLAARREAKWAVEPDLAALLGSSNASSVEKEEDGEAAVAAMFTAKAAEGGEDVAVRIKKVGLWEISNNNSFRSGRSSSSSRGSNYSTSNNNRYSSSSNSRRTKRNRGN